MGVGGSLVSSSESRILLPWEKGKIDAAESLGVCPDWQEGTTTPPPHPSEKQISLF